jgi:hypothetical protein
MVILPEGSGRSASPVGDEVEFTATPNPDGTFTAVNSSGHETVEDADGGDGEHHEGEHWDGDHGGGSERGGH